MDKKHMVLIVDDEKINREILKRILMDEYEVIEADNGAAALEMLRNNQESVSAVLLDLVMPVASGYDFLRQYSSMKLMRNIPVIVSTGDESADNESRCLKLGAWDFIKKPYHAGIIRFRLGNAIKRSDLNVLREMQYREQFDELTGIYKKDKFIEETESRLEYYKGHSFALIHFDIAKFQLFNSIFGREEGDRLLKYIAKLLRDMSKELAPMTYCHEEADTFCICVMYTGKEEFVKWSKRIRNRLNQYKKDYDLVPVFGVYVRQDEKVSVQEMMDKARLAAKECKGNYVKNYAFYTEDLSRNIFKEQLIINNMNSALKEEQFVIYLQPKYELLNNTIEGAEALVRWKDPERGMISPGEFIPIFERNGFIMELDYYVWEHTCQLLRKWLDEGKTPFPISVNISRVSLYNPNLVNNICDLVNKYQVPPALLQLELTESAYTSNPEGIKHAMSQLQKKGFYILMDDFGSGYSSLNVLKDIAVDILKIDMKFMDKCDLPGRSENILASVVRMAKWLNMPVVAEGVETEEQMLFLRSIGCEYVQGYYFAKPMPIEEYEQRAFSEPVFKEKENKVQGISKDSLWNSSSQMEILFSNMLQAVAVYEYDNGDKVEAIRVNNAYYDLFGFKSIGSYHANVIDSVHPDNRAAVVNAFQTVSITQSVAECEFVRILENGKKIWISMKLKYVSNVGEKTVLFGTLADITMQKEVDKELQKYRTALSSINKGVQTILIVDDAEVNRASLRSMFEESYNILEAENGQAAIETIIHNNYEIDMILLDMMMPVMTGEEFMKYKTENPDMADIPVIIITADDSTTKQINTLSMGANDYIVKPFVPEVVIRRVCNVMESTKRFGEVLRGYSVELDAAQRDELTGLHNRKAADRMIQSALSKSNGKQALLMVDIDNFKYINETYGYPTGDRAIKKFAIDLRKYFRQSDIVARYGGDEFIVFVVNTPSEDFIMKRCMQLIQELRPVTDDGIKLLCSIGVAITDRKNVNILELIEKADKALYDAKKSGSNQCSVNRDLVMDYD